MSVASSIIVWLSALAGVACAASAWATIGMTMNALRNGAPYRATLAIGLTLSLGCAALAGVFLYIARHV